MDNSQIEEFSQIWSAAFEVQGKVATDIGVEMAFSALAKHSMLDVRRAVMTHISTSTFAPKPADINQLISGDPESRKLKAWGVVESAIRRFGAYETVVFDDPAIMAAIDEMGGWIELCRVDDNELPFRRNDFVKLYGGYLNRPPTEYPKKLCGVVEQTNQGDYPDAIPLPKLIGDTAKARMVYKNGGDQRLPVAELGDAVQALLDPPE